MIGFLPKYGLPRELIWFVEIERTLSAPKLRHEISWNSLHQESSFGGLSEAGMPFTGVLVFDFQ